MESKKIDIVEIEVIRQELHRIVDEMVDDAIRKHAGGVNTESSKVKCSLLSHRTAIFKGTKPLSVTFPSGHVEHTKTWKKVVTAILVDCNSNNEMHDSLMELRGKIFGNFRSILSNKPDNLKAPIKVDEGLYFEAKYDTETLLYVLKKRVLDVIGYDYRTILIHYKEKERT